MWSWDLEVKVGRAETALLHSPAQVLPWNPFPRLTEGLQSEGFSFPWSAALSVKWGKCPFLLQNHIKGATVCHVEIKYLFRCTCFLFSSNTTVRVFKSGHLVSLCQPPDLLQYMKTIT